MLFKKITKELEENCSSFEKMILEPKKILNDIIDLKDTVLFLEKGAIKVLQNEKKKTYLVMIIEGNTYPIILPTCNIYNTAYNKSFIFETITTTEILTVKKEEFDTLSEAKDFSQYLMMNYEYQYSLTLKVIEERIQFSVKEQLYRYLEKMGTLLKNDRLDFSLKELEKDLGYSRSTILRTLTKLDDEKKITVLRKGVQLNHIK